MKNQKGFTLFELILTLVISIIVLKMLSIALTVPFRAYFILSSQDKVMQIGSNTMQFMQHELKDAYPQSIQISNDGIKKILSFRQVIDKGFMTTGTAAKPVVYYEIGPIITYTCEPLSGNIYRLSEHKNALLANKIHNCDFIYKDHRIDISLSLKKPFNKKVLTKNIFLEQNYE